MIKIKQICSFLLTAFAAVGLTACQSDWLSKLGVDDPSGMFDAGSLLEDKAPEVKQDKMVVNKVQFAPDYKTFSVWTGIVQDIGPYALTDSSQVRIKIEEYDDGVLTSRRARPQLVKAWNTESDQIRSLGVKVLVLIDLSLSEEQIEAEKMAVEEMFTVFNKDNLYIAFMSNDFVTKACPMTQYIQDEYFRKVSSRKYLFRSTLTKIRELSSGTVPWEGARRASLVVFSDGHVYDDNDVPMDPNHFRIEDELLRFKDSEENDIDVFYVNFGRRNDTAEDSEAVNVMTSLCEATGGAYLPQFNWTKLENSILGPDVRSVDANRFDFVNPDGKVYRGDNNQLKILLYSVKDNKLIASATANIREGSIYKPIIVNGQTLGEVIATGVALGLIVLLLTYLVGQLLIPYIRYRLFLRKYVVKHTGGDMVLDGMHVADTCYLCKGRFEKGDEVVVKCEHTMHKSCWDENEYHCPEYGRNCKHGSHFYEKEHLLDRRNASFYLQWILMGIVAAVLAWTAVTIWSQMNSKHVLEYLIPVEQLSASGTHLNQLPSFGFVMSFLLTLGIGILAIRQKGLLTWLNIIGRALLAGILSGILFLLVSAACIALHMDTVGYSINVIPWILSSYLIAKIGTFGTRIKLKKYIVLIAVGISVVSMLLWSTTYITIGVDFRVLMLYSYILYAVTLAMAVASAAPKSEHYFLHIRGGVKEMDIALYKWFRANPGAVVSLGKSVDCSLQLSWDLQGNVAPVHAEITMKQGVPRLRAMEDGVSFSGRPLPVDKYKILSHGSNFQIGNTIFTYQEKDI